MSRLYMAKVEHTRNCPSTLIIKENLFDKVALAIFPRIVSYVATLATCALAVELERFINHLALARWVGCPFRQALESP